MIVLGLTGSIGMGKTTVTRQLGVLGVPGINADSIVHTLIGKYGAAVEEVGHAFPGVVKDHAVDRQALRAQVFGDAKKRKKLEAILHPRVVAAEEAFVVQQRRLGKKAVVLDIPLLFETGAQERCDAVLVVSAPEFIQRQRVLRRPGMNEAILRDILAIQMPDGQKRALADFIIPTGLGKAHSMRALKNCLAELGHET